MHSRSALRGQIYPADRRDLGAKPWRHGFRDRDRPSMSWINRADGESRHVPLMPLYPATTVIFQAEHLNVGTERRVIATFPTGQKEQIGEFKN
jgi:hypothetical protein